MIVELFWLLFAHAMGDVPFQPPSIVNNKHKSFVMLCVHSIIWGGCLTIALLYIGKFYEWKLWFLIIGHFLCDGISSNLVQYSKSKWIGFGDNLFHLLQLLIVYLL